MVDVVFPVASLSSPHADTGVALFRRLLFGCWRALLVGGNHVESHHVVITASSTMQLAKNELIQLKQLGTVETLKSLLTYLSL